MLHFLLGLAGVELRQTARRAATTGLLFALGGFLLLIAAVGILAAVFIALTELYDPIAAALLVAAVALIGSTILLIVAYARLRTPVRRSTYNPLAGLTAPPPSAPLGAAAPPPGPTKPLLNAGTVIGVALGAAIVGLILGRRI